MTNLTRLFLLVTCIFAFTFSQDEAIKKINTKKPMENKRTIIEIETTVGKIVISLYDDLTPKTAANFVGLVSQNYYDGIKFHRVIKDFMLQSGDPNSKDESKKQFWGTGGISIYGEKFEDEFVKSLKHDRKGILSMANSGPNTNGSQFFITLVPTPWLDGKHTIFGEVIEGIEVVEAIGNTKTIKPYDRPEKNIEIKSAKIKTEGSAVKIATETISKKKKPEGK